MCVCPVHRGVMDLLHGSIRRSDVQRAAGSDAALRREVRAGRMRREHWGVYVDVRHDFDEHARWAAALLRAGAGAHLSHATAAAVHDLSIEGPTTDGAIHLTVPHERRPRPMPGVVLHRSARLPPADRIRRHDLAVTGVERTVLDICPTFARERDRTAFIAQVLQTGRTTRTRLLACADRSGGVRGARMLVSVLTLLAPGYETEPEFGLARICHRAGLHVQPQRTIVVGGRSYRLDLLDDGLLIDAEADGSGHLSVALREEDADRDLVLRAVGLEVIRFTNRRIRQEPRLVRRQLEDLRLRRQGLDPPPRLAPQATLLPVETDLGSGRTP